MARDPKESVACLVKPVRISFFTLFRNRYSLAEPYVYALENVVAGVLVRDR